MTLFFRNRVLQFGLMIAIVLPSAPVLADPPKTPVAANQPPIPLLPPPLPSAAPASGKGGVRLSFNMMPLAELVTVVYSEVLKADFVLAPEVAKQQDMISLRLDSRDKAEVKRALAAALSSAGAEIVPQGGYDLIRHRATNPAGSGAPADDGHIDKTDWQLLVYRPKFRPVQHFVDLLSGVFSGRFTASNTGGAMPSQISTDTKGQSSPVPQTNATGKDSDFLIFHGPKDEQAKVKAALQQLDVALPELVINGYLYEVSDLKNDESAIGLILSKIGFSSLVGSVSRTANFFSFAKGGIELVAHNLATDSRFKVVSNPSLVVQSGKPARLVVGDKVAVKTSAVVDKNGNPIESFDYQQSGIQLDITPVLRASGRISLDVSQTLSQFSPSASGDSSPTLRNRELKTSLSVAPGKPVLLGGLKQSKYTESSQGFTFLPWRFARFNENSGTEYVLLLQAEVADETPKEETNP